MKINDLFQIENVDTLCGYNFTNKTIMYYVLRQIFVVKLLLLLNWELVYFFNTHSYSHSVLQGISPTLKYWPHPFLPSPLPPPKKFWICQPPLPLWATPLKILENLSPSPWNGSSSKKRKDSFLKKQKIISNIK